MTMVVAFVLFLAQGFTATITVDAGAEQQPISPNIYGINNALSVNPGAQLNVNWQRLRDAGIHLLRDGGGNNSTKYNWRRKLSSHPDWYNNVYTNDWDYRAQLLREHIPGAQAVYAFQLIGKAAETNDYNFNDWGYNGSQWWPGVGNNWAGGGGPTQGEGDPDLYLMDWPADSTVGILDHWFGENGLSLDPQMFRYWNMDNEPEIWNGTHDDVMPTLLPAEEFMQRYFDVARAARAEYPDIKLLGPVAANEWQWYNWANEKVASGSRTYTWLEYFIKRIGEEQKASGVRLLDVLDIHFYPGETDPADIVQLHRVWFDKSYNYPGANGVKRAGSGPWTNSITSEYVFERCRLWLDQYLGPDHGVTFGVTEMGVQSSDPNVVAVWYASTLGVFADEGVEVFTPWDWKTGMWEVVHLFSRYANRNAIPAHSDRERFVSAHASLNEAGDSLAVTLINRSLDESAQVTVNLERFMPSGGTHPTLTLDDLPASETFVSHTNNALQEGTVAVENGAFTVELPALSTTAVLLAGARTDVAVEGTPDFDALMEVYPNPAVRQATAAFTLPEAGPVEIELFDLLGRRVMATRSNWLTRGAHRRIVRTDDLAAGVYVLRITAGDRRAQRVVTVIE